MTRHPLDPLSLLFGLAFTTIGLGALVTGALTLRWLDPRWALPLVAVVAGLWLLVTSRRRGLSGDAG